MTTKLDPWGPIKIENYEKLFSEFGIEPFEKFKEKFKDNRYVRRGIIFGHRDFDKIVNAIENKKPFAMMTGLMPSGKFHFGHKMIAEEIIWFQSMGAEVYVCVADIEAYVARDIDLERAKDIAREEYLLNYLALGLTGKNLHFYFQSNYKIPYYRFRDTLSKRATFNELSGIYGELTPGKIFAVFTQVADILHPQLPEFSGPMHTVVPVGSDQDPHLRLTRDVAGKLNFILPSSTYHKFMEGLQGGKMSSSDPKSYISLTETPEEARKKIMGAKTGGRTTAEEQKTLGGIPEQCMIYEFFVYHLIEDDSELAGIFHDCKAGKLRCGDCKMKCAELMGKFLVEHRKKRENARATADKILGN